jgi:hypothetical protein
MEHDGGAFDLTGYFKLLDEVMPDHGTGVVSARIHIRDGIPWAVDVQFHNTEGEAA